MQEKLNDEESDAGRIPRHIEVDLFNDMVDLVVPGDIVHISGTVKVENVEEGKV